MKKKFIAILAGMTLLVFTSFANTTIEPTKEIKTEFSRTFTNATDVKWQFASSFYMATFKQGPEYLTAYFNPLGSIEAVSRNLSVSSLPLLLQENVPAKIQKAWVSEVSELVRANGTEYYLTIENANTKTVYKASDFEWSVYKVMNK